MYSKLSLAGATALCLTACAAPSPPPSGKRLLPPSLTAPCEYPLPEILTNGQLARAYVSALDNLADCSDRHRRLVEATKETP